MDALKEFTASSEFLFSADRAFEVVDVHTIKDAKLDMPIIVVLWWNPAASASTLDPSPLAYRIRGDINPEGLAASIKIDGQTIAH